MRRYRLLLTFASALFIVLFAVAGCRGNREVDRQIVVDDDASPSDTYTITTAAATLTIWLEPFGWKLSSPAKGDVTQTYDYGQADSFSYAPNGVAQYLQTFSSAEPIGDGVVLHYRSSSNKNAKVVVTAQTDRTFKFIFSVEDNQGWFETTQSMHMADGEAIYGLMERIDADYNASELYPKEIGGLDMRGQFIPMVVFRSMAVYVPFYQSSQGYGLYIDSSFYGSYDLGMTQSDDLRISFQTAPNRSAVLTYYVFYGPDHDTILDEYTAITGRPFIPPEWGFKHWRWRDECTPQPAKLDGHEINADVADDLSHYDSLGFPIGNYEIDRPWTPGPEGFEVFAFDPARFMNSNDMLQSFYSRGYHFHIWAGPWAIGSRAGTLGWEAQKYGYWAPDSDRYIDFTNPAAVAWWEKHIYDFAKATQISGWKLDRGDEDNPSLWWEYFWDGRTGAELRNLYPVLYQKTFFETMQSLRGDDFVLIYRSGYAGSQQYGIANYGDVRGALSDKPTDGIDLGLRSAVIAQLHMAFMGFPIWGSNTGGYQEFRDRDVFARWLEFSAFSGTMDIGGTGAHAPWNMPTYPNYDKEMIDIYRTYTQLHHDLIAYIYPYAQTSHQNGHAVVRPLAFDYPDDPNVKDMWDEYFYGPSILVAPIWKKEQRDRNVYIPAGQFADYWNPSHSIAGPMWLHVDVPLNQIPIYIRKGTNVLGRTW